MTKKRMRNGLGGFVVILVFVLFITIVSSIHHWLLSYDPFYVLILIPVALFVVGMIWRTIVLRIKK